MSKKLNLIGKRFGRLVVVKEAGRNKQKGVVWECRCDCNTIKLYNGSDLQCGKVKSCGCLRRELLTKHGMVGTSAYRSWASMLQRCNNKNNLHYSYYGGRGLKVCKQWHKFENFYKDMGERPQGLTLERI